MVCDVVHLPNLIGLCSLTVIIVYLWLFLIFYFVYAFLYWFSICDHVFGIFCHWRVRVVVLNSASNNTRRKPPTYRKSLTHFITLRYIEYTSPWAWFELTTLVVIVSLIIVYIHVYHILLLQFSRFLVFDKIRLTDVTEFCTTTSSEGCATWYPTAFPDCVSNNII